ncbi:MAG TPA: prolyl oligopeptidase family serine peptidase [Bryobacteraceae bacterium]|nr:prolyl oligopeptidase family serine peptidase [Bryobacteraceae bacterium]
MTKSPHPVKVVVAAALTLAITSLRGQDLLPKVSYPPTPKDNIVNNYFGTKVPAPYQWMEDLNSKAVQDWVSAENRATFDYLAKLPLREHFLRRITQLWDYPKASIPVREGGRYFYSKNSGLERQSPVYLRPTLDGPATLVLDPNVLSPDGSMALAQWQPSRDGRLLAYGVSEGGADWETLHVRNVESGKDLSDEVHWVRFSGISWTADNNGFFYSRYPEPPKGKVLEAALSGHTIYYHRLGTPQSQDQLIYARPDLPTWFVDGGVTEDGRYLLVSISKGAENNNRLYYADLGDPLHPVVGAPVHPVIEQDGAEFAPIGNSGATLYLRTDLASPNRKVSAVDVTRPAPSQWKTIIPEGKLAIQDVRLVGGRFVAQYLVDAQSRVSLFSLAGDPQGDLPLPGTGTLGGLGGREDEPDIFYSFSSPLFPSTRFVYDPLSQRRTSFEAAKPPVDVTQYETKALFATSKDGTRVPFFLTWRKGLALDSSHPTMIYGYGGFSISTLPDYWPDVPAWLELGGIWVTASTRGGSEYGEAWHKAGYLSKKQNVFDDFIAVAEYLVKEKYSSPARLGIMGGSNGGLLVGAVEVERPDLYAVALPAVGVMDMLRYDRFTGGHAWVTEYGSSSNATDFAYLIKYSPVQDITPGVCYPATLVTTADHDDRVVPSHSFKFTAAMQADQVCNHPVLIRVETEASHGYRPTDKLIAEIADEWAFAASAMGMRAP